MEALGRTLTRPIHYVLVAHPNVIGGRLENVHRSPQMYVLGTFTGNVLRTLTQRSSNVRCRRTYN